MKASYKFLLAAALSAPLLTGCIEESVPTQYVLSNQLVGNSNAITAFANAMPAHMNVIATIDQQYHFDAGMPSMLQIRNVMTDDMHVRYAGGFDWYSSWAVADDALGPNYLVCQYPWNYYYAHVLTTNNSIKAIDPETEIALERYYLGASLATRAATYLDMARMWEVLPTAVNNGNSPEGNNILGLSCVIITDETSESDMRNNPRAEHSVMFEFIKNDLERAIPYMTGYARPSKTLPDVAVAKGLLARLYLWDASYQAEVKADQAAANASYAKAAQYAREAISESGATPLTREEWLSTTAGFNDINVSSWMWGGQYSAEDDAVVAGGIRTWTSVISPEQMFGYAGSECGAMPEIGASFYNRINNNDWRKLAFVAPEGTPLSGQEPFLDPEFAATYFDGPYIAIKFRPGQGNMEDPNVGAVVGYPMMRVEEMYFIEAEATAHQNPGNGLSLLKQFMTTYRYPTYNATVSGDAAVVDEIIFQKRIELWGEGQNFFDVKRLNMSVTRFYNGTNFEDNETYNTVGRPAWMNFCIVAQEENNNEALVGYNTPSPAGIYKPLTND